MQTFYIGVGIVSGCLLLAQVAISIYNARRNRIDLPGPKGWPFIGIGFDLPKRPRKLLSEYRTKYGDAFKIRLGWYNWVFFNTPDGVKEVFDKQVSEEFSEAILCFCIFVARISHVVSRPSLLKALFEIRILRLAS